MSFADVFDGHKNHNSNFSKFWVISPFHISANDVSLGVLLRKLYAESDLLSFDCMCKLMP